MKALRALGVESKLNAAACDTNFLNIRSWDSGRYISRTRRSDFKEKFGAPNLSVHRADLLAILAGALKSTDIRTGLRAVSVEGRAGNAVARFADGSEIEADIVVGADGIHSVVRGACSAPTCRASPAASAGAAWRRRTRCRATLI